MKKTFVIATLTGLACASMAADVADLKMCASTLGGKANIKGWIVDDYIVLATSGEVIVGDFGFWEMDTANYKGDGDTGCQTVAYGANCTINDNGDFLDVHTSALVGKESWDDPKGKYKLCLKGFAIGSLDIASLGTWSSVQYSLSIRNNEKLSDLSNDDLVDYIADKLGLSSAEADELADSLGFTS